jgi:hypothetical protein
VSPAGSPVPSASARFSAWRDLVRQSQPPAGEPEASELHVPERHASEPHASEPHASEPHASELDGPEPHAFERPASELDTLEPQAPGFEALEPEAPEFGALELPALERHAFAPQASGLDAPRALSPAPAPADLARLATAPREGRVSWRDDVVAWTRAITAGAIAADAPAAPPIDALIARFDLAPALHPVLVLLYGAHLCGERGVAPAEVARVLDHRWPDHRWDEALGRGELAERGVAEYAGSRVALSPLVLRVLDELPPATGVLIGRPGMVALLGPCVVVAGDEPLVAVATRCAPQVGGAILVATGEPVRAQLVLEARARGAAPMLRAVPDAAPGDAAIFVTGDAELAERLGLPRLG